MQDASDRLRASFWLADKPAHALSDNPRKKAVLRAGLPPFRHGALLCGAAGLGFRLCTGGIGLPASPVCRFGYWRPPGARHLPSFQTGADAEIRLAMALCRQARIPSS